MVKNIKNVMVDPKNKFNYSRSAFPYSVCHGTNITTGKIVPVSVINCMPGDTLPKKFGFVLQSAPLLGPSVDNLYTDIIGVWCPTRLVMGDHNEWLGDNDQYAWTLGNNVHLPKITTLNLSGVHRTIGLTNYTPKISRTYLAEHYLAPHIGCRWFDDYSYTGWPDLNLPNLAGANSRFGKGISVIPSRAYDFIWNRIFRNENVQDPILFSKQSGSDLSLDVQNYQEGLGKLHSANRLKNFFTTAWISPSIQTVNIAGINNAFPVITKSTAIPFTSTPVPPVRLVNVYGNVVSGLSNLFADGSDLKRDNATYTPSGSSGVVFSNLWADMSSLTVNSLYYSIMLQRYMNKASEGRRPVEFYKEFFGVDKSDAVYDDPELVFHKRYPVNISRVIATGNSMDLDNNLTTLGTQGAYSLTSVGGSMPEFTATEYGIFFIFAVIRTQESFSTGCDRYLSDHELLSTYLPVFDHIGKDFIDLLELANYFTGSQEIFGYQDAWYHDRYFVSHNVGIFSPGEALDYMTFARSFDPQIGGFTVNDAFIKQSPAEVDRMLQLPVYFLPANYTETTEGTTELIGDENGELYESDRYQFVITFCHAGEIIRTMSKDSEQLLFGTSV